MNPTGGPKYGPEAGATGTLWPIEWMISRQNKPRLPKLKARIGTQRSTIQPESWNRLQNATAISSPITQANAKFAGNAPFCG